MMIIVFKKIINLNLLLSTKSMTFINLDKLDKLSFIYNNREMFFKIYITHIIFSYFLKFIFQILIHCFIYSLTLLLFL